MIDSTHNLFIINRVIFKGLGSIVHYDEIVFGVWEEEYHLFVWDQDVWVLDGLDCGTDVELMRICLSLHVGDIT